MLCYWKLAKQNSSLLSLDYSKGFGGKYGVDKDKALLALNIKTKQKKQITEMFLFKTTISSQSTF